MKHIHIYWSGPYSLEELSELQDNTRDYGIYQIYGQPVYGSSVLLYIGKAERQTFGTRISQENWFTNRNAGDLNVNLGRLAGNRQPSYNICLCQKCLGGVGPPNFKANY